MCTDLLSLMDVVVVLFDVTCLPGSFAIAGNLYSGFVINHEDGWYGLKTLCRFAPLFSSEVCHVVEEHANVCCGHRCGACGHIFGFRG